MCGLLTSKNSSSGNLHDAIKYKNDSLVDKLLDEGAEVNTKDRDGRTALHVAVLFNNAGVVDKLIDKGADINAKDNNGDTPLKYVVDKFTGNYFLRENTYSEILDRLVSKGAQLYIPYSDAVSPLHAAVMMNNSSLVEKLLQRGFPVNVRDCYGVTPLHIAFRLTHGTSTKPINILLDHGADINAKDSDGCTPLQVAVRYGSTPAVQFILSKGANVNTKNKWGNSPLRDAIQKAVNEEKVAILLSYGASFETETAGGTSPHQLIFESCLQHYPKDFRIKCRDHIIKMYAAGFTVPNEAIKKVSSIPGALDHKQLEEECRHELRVINKTTVANNKLGIVLSSRHRPFYMANKELVKSIQELINSPHFASKFPNYALILYCTFSKSRKIYNLFSLATRSLINLIDHNQVLPEEVILQIVELLDDSTQRKLIRSGLYCPVPNQARDWADDLPDFIRPVLGEHYLSDLELQRLLRSMEPTGIEEWNDSNIYPL